MKINKISLFALMLILAFVVVACTPADDNMNDTGMYDRNRLTTQTRIGDWNRNTDMDSGMNNGLNDGLNNINMGQNNGLDNNNLNNGMTRPYNDTNFGNMGTRANEIANEIAALPEVDRASVVIDNDTALVGCSLRGNTQGTMTNALRQKIRGIVQENTDVRDVSVTTDPDVTGRIQTMSNSILQGNPIEDFADEIRNLIRDITTNTRTNTNTNTNRVR